MCCVVRCGVGLISVLVLLGQGMEVFCQELFSRGDLLGLSSLATDLLQQHRSDSRGAAGWLAAGLYCQLRGAGDKAMGFLDKVRCVRVPTARAHPAA